MTNIRYEVSRVSIEFDRYRLSSTTAWLGDLVISEEEFNKIGRPTAGDFLILDIRRCKESAKT